MMDHPALIHHLRSRIGAPGTARSQDAQAMIVTVMIAIIDEDHRGGRSIEAEGVDSNRSKSENA